MIKQRIIELLTEAVNKAQESGKLPSVAIPEITIEHPQNPNYGDYASSLPLKLARATGTSPLAIAEDIAGLIASNPEIEAVAVAPPGFINFTLKSDWLTTAERTGGTSGRSRRRILGCDGRSPCRRPGDR